ncbi:MAG: hypothetical protein Q7T20_06620 [Saprospiraceae bacterium]|nr:hypothetical protein [Saprospiraceae bacterium]
MGLQTPKVERFVSAQAISLTFLPQWAFFASPATLFSLTALFSAGIDDVLDLPAVGSFERNRLAKLWLSIESIGLIFKNRIIRLYLCRRYEILF